MRKFGPCAIPIPGPLNVRLVTFYVQDAGYGDTDLIMYMHAEAALERCLERAERESVWRFKPEAMAAKS